jgi:hypothetical protein
LLFYAAAAAAAAVGQPDENNCQIEWINSGHEVNRRAAQTFFSPPSLHSHNVSASSTWILTLGKDIAATDPAHRVEEQIAAFITQQPYKLSTLLSFLPSTSHNACGISFLLAFRRRRLLLLLLLLLIMGFAAFLLMMLVAQTLLSPSNAGQPIGRHLS